MKMLNRQAQVGETMTWVVATLIIIFILVVSVYFAVVLGKAKNLGVGEKNANVEGKFNLLNLETNFAHILSENKNQEKINSWIKNEKDK